MGRTDITTGITITGMAITLITTAIIIIFNRTDMHQVKTLLDEDPPIPLVIQGGITHGDIPRLPHHMEIRLATEEPWINQTTDFIWAM